MVRGLWRIIKKYKNSMAQKKTVLVHDIHDKEREVSIEELTFRPSVYGIAFAGDKVLLSRQWDGYDLPGGGVELGETLAEAVKREFWEETGFKIEVVMPVYCGTSFFCWPSVSAERPEGLWNCPLTYFLCRVVGGELSDENFEASERSYINLAEWVSLDKIDQLKFYNSINSPEVIRRAFELNNNR